MNAEYFFIALFVQIKPNLFQILNLTVMLFDNFSYKCIPVKDHAEYCVQAD